MLARPKIIAVVGLSGVGKSQVVAHLAARLNCSVVYFGGIVLQEMARLALEKTPENERLVRESLREKHGMAAIALLACDQIKSQKGHQDTVVIDGLYSHEELAVLQQNFADEVCTLAVHSQKAIRGERLANRPERPLTLCQMLARDEAEITKLNKARPIAQADYHVINDGSLDALYSEIDRLPIVRDPA